MKIKKMLLAVSLVFCILFSALITTTTGVYADIISTNTEYSNVVDDLKIDPFFVEEDYPVDMEDYSLQVIQLAEGDNNELLIYVYQPCSPNEDLRATHINISTSNDKLSFNHYKLIFLNNDGVFYKYQVLGYKVKTTTTERRYEISSIFRNWNERYDEQASGGNTISEVAFNVGKEFNVSTTGGYSLTCKDIETIQVVNKFVGFVRYPDGYTGIPGMMVPVFQKPGYDSHFVAFSTDKQIDKLMEADVYYQYQSYSAINGLAVGFSETFGDIYSKTETITYTDKAVVDAFDTTPWHNRHTYTFDRIQTTDDFITSEEREYMYENALFSVNTQDNISDEGIAELEGTEWVVRFAETEYNSYRTGSGLAYIDNVDYTIVGNVTILRLAFETDGIFYNLGVVDNKQTGSGSPINVSTTTFELTDLAKIILAVLILVVALILLGPILPVIFSVIGWVLKFVFKAVIWVVSLPFRFIGWIFKKRE